MDPVDPDPAAGAATRAPPGNPRRIRGTGRGGGGVRSQVSARPCHQRSAAAVSAQRLHGAHHDTSDIARRRPPARGLRGGAVSASRSQGRGKLRRSRNLPAVALGTGQPDAVRVLSVRCRRAFLCRAGARRAAHQARAGVPARSLRLHAGRRPCDRLAPPHPVPAAQRSVGACTRRGSRAGAGRNLGRTRARLVDFSDARFIPLYI